MVVFSHYMALIYNESFDKPVARRAKALVEETPDIVAYIERIKPEFQSYLATRISGVV